MAPRDPYLFTAGSAEAGVASVTEGDSVELMTLAGLARWTWDPYCGTVMSSEMDAMLGVDMKIIGSETLLRDHCHPDDQAKVTGVLSGLARDGGSVIYENRVRAGDGRWLRLRVVCKTKPHPRGGYCIQGIVQDVTEAAEARDAAVRAEQQVRALMDEARMSALRLKLALGAAQAGVFEVGHATRSFWCSPEFVRLIGRELSYDEAASEFWPFIHPDDQQTVVAAVQVWRAGSHQPVDVRFVRPDGSVRWMRVYYELRRDDSGRAVSSVGLVLDIDERMRQEIALVEAKREALAAADAKSGFLASVSHEIRTPMNGILGVMHLLRRESLSDDGHLLLDEAIACGGMLSELLNDVLDFSKIEANQLELNPEPIDPESTVLGVASLLRPQASAKTLSLTVEAEAGGGWVCVDPIRLRQALFNLIGNAVKFTVQGSVHVRMIRLDSPSRLRFEVIDSGIGMSASVQERLFQRFYQADSSTTRRFGGTGLGLAITKRLAEMMGGGVGFSSVEGLGSTFWLEVAAEAVETPGVAEPEAVDGLGGLRVLVVEDNPTNRLIARKLLEQFGAFVSEAEDGERGVAAAAERSFDLILMDVQMPGMDGAAATRLIRGRPGPNQSTAIIALTANVMAHQRRAYLDAGMDGVVAKPISPMLLLNEIARVAVADLHDDAAVA